MGSQPFFGEARLCQGDSIPFHSPQHDLDAHCYLGKVGELKTVRVDWSDDCKPEQAVSPVMSTSRRLQ